MGFSDVSYRSFEKALTDAEIVPDEYEPGSVICLGCGHGHELLPLRLAVGEEVEIVGVDRKPELLDSEMVQQHLELSGARVIIVDDASDPGQVVSQVGCEPALVVARHPGPIRDEQERLNTEKLLRGWTHRVMQRNDNLDNPRSKLVATFFDLEGDKELIANEKVFPPDRSKVLTRSPEELRDNQLFSSGIAYHPDAETVIVE